MNIYDHIEHWIAQADNDLLVAESLFEDGHYPWALFIGHLVLEKALKGFYIKSSNEIIPPKIHNLVRLAEMSGLEMDNEIRQFFYEVNDFNLEARYADYKSNFNKIADREFSLHYLLEIKKKYQWIKTLLK